MYLSSGIITIFPKKAREDLIYFESHASIKVLSLIGNILTMFKHSTKSAYTNIQQEKKKKKKKLVLILQVEVLI